MDAAILDTDTLSEVIRRRNVAVAENAAAYLRAHTRLAFSTITKFEAICERSVIFVVDDDVLDCAADLWVRAKRHGLPAGDADLAATALHG